jgi:hypothetical protein
MAYYEGPPDQTWALPSSRRYRRQRPLRNAYRWLALQCRPASVASWCVGSRTTCFARSMRRGSFSSPSRTTGGALGTGNNASADQVGRHNDR